ncbi:FAD-dependent oxidoreductase [Nocardia sp. NPDC051030]|uniref:NAD(P)/FAD-dependent oxidoreductase n=1 Tax=Nocardia sp. NPDC051030 TaxID=3155162 RepID=UPI00343FBB99
MSINHHIVVLGGGYAGTNCTIRLARRLRGREDVHITLVNPSPRFTERLRLHQLAAGHLLTEHRFADLLEDTGVEFVCGEATAIDTEARQVSADALGQRRTLSYDTLVYALGSATETYRVPGVDQHAHTINSPQQAARLGRRLAGLAAGSAVAVCGGGLTGVETAAEIAEAYPALRVSLVSRGEPAAVMGERARAYVRGAFDRLRVSVHLGTITKVLPDAIELRGGELVAADLTLWTGGVRVPSLAAESEIDTDARGLVKVDPTLRSLTHPDTYAIGDSAAIRQAWGPLHGTCHTAMASATHAADQIARQLRGAEPKPFRFGYFRQPVSLGRSDAIIQFTHHDDTPRRFLLTGPTAVHYKESTTSSPLKRMARTKSTFGLLAPTGTSKGGLATRKPHPG